MTVVVFMNKHFVKRDYECTNIVACVSDRYDQPLSYQGLPTDMWGRHSVTCREYDLTDLEGLDLIGDVAGVKYYGYL